MSTSATSRSESVELGFPAFLTAYDPSDLPGGSRDPLGFERGYLLLADKILPGLTNVADEPRYFSVLCAGASLADVGGADPPRIQYQKRLDSILRFERYWALANVLASRAAAGGELPEEGVRGVSYATVQADLLLRSGARRTDADFQLLSRQVPYGVVGIYGAVADGMRLIDRRTFTLTPDLGEPLAERFLEQAETPVALLKAIRNHTDMAIDPLTQWGARSHISGAPFDIEQKSLADALHRHPVRSRMAVALAAHPFEDRQDTELQRLERLLPDLREQPENRDLCEAVGAILAFEQSYRLASLGFERLLWLCRTLPAASIEVGRLAADSVLARVGAELPAAVEQLGAALDSAVTDAFRQDLHRLDDTRHFLERAAAACGDSDALTEELMMRHADVQRGKFDKGRRKMPWLEVTTGRISLTMTRVGGLDREATVPSQIGPHPYRLPSADALTRFAGGA